MSLAVSFACDVILFNGISFFFFSLNSYDCSDKMWYEGKSISNLPIPFSIDRDSKIFMPCFNICFMPEGKIAP